MIDWRTSSVTVFSNFKVILVQLAIGTNTNRPERKMHFSNTYFLFIWWNIFVSQFEITKVSAEMNEVQALKHLARYGYLDMSLQQTELDKQVSKEILSKALRDYQEFNNLGVTGNLDKSTIDKMKQPRCGVPDKFPGNLRTKRYAYKERKWAVDEISYYFKSNSAHVPADIGLREIHRAFEEWEKYIPLRIKRSLSEDNANILVSFETGYHGDEPPFDGRGGVLAHALSPQERIKSFIHFDDDEDWHFVRKQKNRSYDFYSKPNLFQIAVHEVGHSLGLGHSKNPEAIMQAYYDGVYDANFTLSSDDITGIQGLYPEIPTIERKTGNKSFSKTSSKNFE